MYVLVTTTCLLSCSKWTHLLLHRMSWKSRMAGDTCCGFWTTTQTPLRWTLSSCQIFIKSGVGQGTFRSTTTVVVLLVSLCPMFSAFRGQSDGAGCGNKDHQRGTRWNSVRVEWWLMICFDYVRIVVHARIQNFVEGANPLVIAARDARLQIGKTTSTIVQL